MDVSQKDCIDLIRAETRRLHAGNKFAAIRTEEFAGARIDEHQVAARVD